MKLLFTFLFFSSACFGQSKKDQIVALYNLVDSLNIVISITIDNADKEATELNTAIEALNKEIIRLKNDLSTLPMVISDNDKLRAELVELTKKNKRLIAELTGTLIQLGTESFIFSEYSDHVQFEVGANIGLTEENRIANDKKVFRKGTSLEFALENGRKLSLVDKVDGYMESYEKYSFSGSLENSNYWEVSIGFFEGHKVLLINKSNGSLTYIIGSPYISPDGKQILVANGDIEAGYTTNGIELFEISNDSIILIGRSEFTEWAPGKVKWLDNSKIIMSRGVFNEQYEYMETNIILSRM